MHSNVMLRFMVQALQDPPLCSSTIKRWLGEIQQIDCLRKVKKSNESGVYSAKKINGCRKNIQISAFQIVRFLFFSG
jgi:hypothetical protein